MEKGGGLLIQKKEMTTLLGTNIDFWLHKKVSD
jgi:hypothetical protein